MNKIKNLRKLGFHAYKYLWIAKIMAFYLSRINMQVYWGFVEHDLILLLSIADAEKIGKLQPNGKKLRMRDMNRLARFRYPDKTWGIIRKAK
jgi:hypothetical protein